MKKILLIALSVVAISSCNSLYEDFTDIQPKGKNLLSSAEELELLLNTEFQYSGFTDFKTMSSDIIATNSPVMSTLSQPKKSRTSIMWTFDDTAMDEFADLTNTDVTYSDFYGLIGTVCNPILAAVDLASGSQAKKDQVAAEAHALRAWALYILVNKYAKAYNPATAATDPAIPVYLENDELGVAARQWTVQEVYDLILSDAQAAIDLNAIPAVAENKMRASKAMPYALKTFALLAMQKYDEAIAAGDQCIALNPEICDYYSDTYTNMQKAVTTQVPYAVVYRGKKGIPEDIIMTFDNAMGDWYTYECMDFFEEGHAMLDRIADQDKFMGYIFGSSGYSAMQISLPGMIGTFDLNSFYNPFGIKTTQVYLAVAEAYLEKGDVSNAMKYVDQVRKNRINPEVYQPLQGAVSSKADAILAYKKTAHGEGVLTVWNFVDRKRWNQVEDFKQSWSRTLDKTYTLAPDSPLWVFPFPKSAMSLNANVKQNYDRL